MRPAQRGLQAHRSRRSSGGGGGGTRASAAAETRCVLFRCPCAVLQQYLNRQRQQTLAPEARPWRLAEPDLRPSSLPPSCFCVACALQISACAGPPDPSVLPDPSSSSTRAITERRLQRRRRRRPAPAALAVLAPTSRTPAGRCTCTQATAAPSQQAPFPSS